MSAVDVGDVWKELDPRLNREVEILKVDDNRVTVRALKSRRVTTNALKRFLNAYRLIAPAKPTANVDGGK